jgi:hypothetical protein
MKFVMVALATLLMTFVAQAQRGPGGRPPRSGGGIVRPTPGYGGGGSWQRAPGRIGGGYHRGGGRWGGGVYYPTPSYPRYGNRCGWDGFYCRDTYVGGGVACAPEMVEGNVTATAKTLNALVATPAFANAKTFKSELAQVAALKDAGEQAQAYLQLAGIDSGDKAAVAAFIGSRDAKGAWITDLQRNADLSNAQAEAVATSLQTALRGNLR